MMDALASFDDYAGPIVPDSEPVADAPQASLPDVATPSDIAPEPIRFKSADELAGFRKQFPEKASLSDADFLDWFGKSRTIPTSAVVDAPPANDGLEDYHGPIITDHETLAQHLGAGARGVMRGAGQLADFATSPIKALGNLATGDETFSPTSYADMADAAASKLGLPEERPGTEQAIGAGISAGTAGLLTAGAATPFAAASPVAAAIAASPGVETLSSGASGMAGDAARQSGAGPIGQTASALAAGLTVGGAASAARGIANAAGPRELNDLAGAFERQQVPQLPADAGGHFTRMLTAGTSKLTLGGIPLEAAARRSVAAARNALTRIAEGIGAPYRTIEGQSDNLGAGLAAQRGVKETLGAGGTKQAVGERLYRAIPVADEANASVSNTRQALADLNEGLPSNEELSKLVSDPRLQAYERAFKGEAQDVPVGILDANGKMITRPVQKGGKINWRDLQNFRSYIGELAGRPTLQDSTSKGALKRLYGALSEDMRATATDNKALPQFTRANNYWRALETRREQILTPLLGKNLDLHGSAAFRQIEQWSTHNGDVFALGRALRSMPETEAGDIRATLFDRLGTVSKGRQDESGLVWSPADFVTHWSGLSSRAKAVLFPGAEYRQSIDDLVRIASAQKTATRLGQGSPTAHLLQGGQVAGRAGVFVMNMFTNPLAAIAVGADVGGELAVGKLLASPKFARWLASAPAKPNAAASLAHINRLSAVAASEPQIANEVLHLQERLAQAFVPTKLAAEPDNRGTR